jgi:beta-phosphoglucomutase-like phosphatase (HAD superfamily)
MTVYLPGIGAAELGRAGGLVLRPVSGPFMAGLDGVVTIAGLDDGSVDFIAYDEGTLAAIHGPPAPTALYSVPPVEPPALDSLKAVFMDLDGTTVLSEPFWIGLIEETLREIMADRRFALEECDLPFLSGRPIAAHLTYALRKYCPDRSLAEARDIHTRLSAEALAALLDGTGNLAAMQPHPGLKEFLLAMRARCIPVALVTSGTAEKAWPELVAVFRGMGLGNPYEMYAAIVCAGQTISPGRLGTLGVLAAKPHPWLYSEAAMALGLEGEDLRQCLGIEDTPTGAIALRLAGLPVVGAAGDAIARSGLGALLVTATEDYRSLITA